MSIVEILLFLLKEKTRIGLKHDRLWLVQTHLNDVIHFQLQWHFGPYIQVVWPEEFEYLSVQVGVNMIIKYMKLLFFFVSFWRKFENKFMKDVSHNAYVARNVEKSAMIHALKKIFLYCYHFNKICKKNSHTFYYA